MAGIEQKTAVVTDTGSDLPQELLLKHTITAVPLTITFGDRVLSEDDDLLAEMIRNPDVFPTTSAPSVGMFIDSYRKISAENIISIHIASKHSGTFGSAVLAAEMIKNEKNVIVFDSQTVSFGTGMLAIKASCSEKQEAREIIEELEDFRKRMMVFAFLDTLSYLEKGGRAEEAIRLIARMMKIKPTIRVVNNEKVSTVKKSRTTKGAIEDMAKRVLAMEPLEKVAIIEFGANKNAKLLNEKIGQVNGQEIGIFRAGPVIGTHGGPGLLGVIAVKKT